MGAGWKYYGWCHEVRKLSALVQPAPAMAWVFVDEHPDSINDALLYVNASIPVANAQWFDWPASYHDGACGFCFADGHSEIHKWRDGRTTPVLKEGQQLQLNVASPNNQDVFWMQDHSTRAQ